MHQFYESNHMKLFKIVLIYLSQKRKEKVRREKFYFNNCKQLHNNDGLPKMKVKTANQARNGIMMQ